MSLSRERIRQVLEGVTYKDWRVRFMDNPMRFRFEWEAPDAYGDPEEKVVQVGRSWLLDRPPPESHMDLLQTVLLAILTAEEHEARERFEYHGRRIFSPHQSRPELLTYELVKEG